MPGCVALARIRSDDLPAGRQLVDRAERHAAVGHGVERAFHLIGLDAVGEQGDDVHVVGGARAAVLDANLVDRFLADRDRAARVAHVELQVGQRDDVGLAVFVSVRSPCGGGSDLQLIRARRLHQALELHVVVVAGTERADVPRHFAALGVERLAFAGAGELGAFGQRDADGDVFGRGRARIADAEEIGGLRAGVFLLGSAPIDFQLRLAAEDFLVASAASPPSAAAWL